MSYRVPLRSLLVTFACLALPGAGAATATAADEILWSNDSNPGVVGAIAFASLDGSTGGTLALPAAAPANGPLGLALDSATGRLFWGNEPATGSGAIGFASLDASAGGMLALANGAAVGTPYDVAIDPGARRVYWADTAGSISSGSLDGPDGGPLATPSGVRVTNPTGMVVDPVDRRLWWINLGIRVGGGTIGGGIVFMDLDSVPPSGGTLPSRGDAPLTPAMRGLAVDAAGRRVYWANEAANSISYESFDGQQGGTLTAPAGANVSLPLGLAIDPTARRIYWVNGDGSISFSALDGSAGGTLTIPAGAPIDQPEFPILLFVPRPAAPPAIAGGSSAGSALSCSKGSWAPDHPESSFYEAPASYAYQWSVNGADIPGATQSTLTPQSAGGYRCRVTASNHAGSATQTSEPHAVAGATRPALSGVSLLRKRFRAGTIRTRGTVLRFASSEAGRLSVVVERARPGHKVKGRGKVVCKVVRRAVKRGGCTVLARVATLTRTIKAGRGSVALSGLVGRRRMAPGVYRITVTARDAAGNVSKPVRLTFTILAG